MSRTHEIFIYTCEKVDKYYKKVIDTMLSYLNNKSVDQIFKNNDLELYYDNKKQEPEPEKAVKEKIDSYFKDLNEEINNSKNFLKMRDLYDIWLLNQSAINSFSKKKLDQLYELYLINPEKFINWLNGENVTRKEECEYYAKIVIIFRGEPVCCENPRFPVYFYPEGMMNVKNILKIYEYLGVFKNYDLLENIYDHYNYCIHNKIRIITHKLYDKLKYLKNELTY